jgi:hypothetical protein
MRADNDTQIHLFFVGDQGIKPYGSCAKWKGMRQFLGVHFPVLYFTQPAHDQASWLAAQLFTEFNSLGTAADTDIQQCLDFCCALLHRHVDDAFKVRPSRMTGLTLGC